jgi:hypothetical protein
MLKIKYFGATIFIVEKHEVGQSSHNHILDYKNDFEVYQYQPGNVIIKDLDQKVYVKVKTKRHECLEENSQRFTQCMNNFIMMRLSCTLPWLELGGSRAVKGNLKK